MSDGASGTLIAEVGLGLVFNGVHAVSAGHNPFPTFIAGGFFLGGLMAVAQFVDASLAVTVGALYLLASFLFHGEVFINLLTRLTGSPSAYGAPSRPASVPA